MPMTCSDDGADLPTVNFDPKFDEFRRIYGIQVKGLSAVLVIFA